MENLGRIHCVVDVGENSIEIDPYVVDFFFEPVFLSGMYPDMKCTAQVIGMEGEIFARYQLDIEAEFAPALLCGFANGCIGYVPTADEYPKGGYEVNEAYKVYPSVQMIAPASEALIRHRVAELGARVRRELIGR